MKKRRKPMPRPDYDRDIFQLLRAIRGKTPAEISRQSFLSASTISNLRKGPSHGGTRWPRHTTMCELARIAGRKWALVDDDHGERPTEGRRHEIRGRTQ